MARKSIMDMTLQELEVKQLEHRLQHHGTANLDVFFDCAACGAIEARLRHLRGKERKEEKWLLNNKP
jgi:hypothetical protein